MANVLFPKYTHTSTPPWRKLETKKYTAFLYNAVEMESRFIMNFLFKGIGEGKMQKRMFLSSSSFAV
jgi:hypothetical protein